MTRPDLTLIMSQFDNLAEASDYFNENRFVPKRLADEIMKENHFFFDGNFLYQYDSGVYRPISDYAIRSLCMTRLGERFRKSHAEEVIHYIQVAKFRKPEENDLDTRIINVKNGLLDWKKRELHPHSPKHISTIQLPVNYKDDAICPSIDMFFRQIVPVDTMPMVYEWFGYSMIPSTRYEKALMLTGEGSNGKSKFIELYESFIGTDNISNIPLQDLEGNRFKLALLHGKLANTFADIPAKALEKSSVFKTVVSGDRTSGELKGRDSFDFKPFARLTFSANELPRSSDLTHGFFRRWLIIPFLNKFGPGGIKADPDIMDKIRTDEEMSGLLNWALDGLHNLSSSGGFTPNQSTEDAIKDYQREIDNVATFVEECCIIQEDAYVERQRAYDIYSQWCSDSGYKAFGKIKFYKRIESLHPTIRIVKPMNSTRRYVGFGITE